MFRPSIEKGRHTKPEKTPRDRRFCKLCANGYIETEEHFLLDCKLYDQIKLKYNLRDIEIGNFFSENTHPATLAQYLIEAFELRANVLELQ